MSLQEYRRKRDFSRTREPRAGAAPARSRPIFVVQLHHASRRHYDFRLQVGDTLKSWAVPKGPSFDPKVKRLAAQVEDHPIGYAGFEGEIPEGQYGGGHVALFDRGAWSTDGDPAAQLAKGHLRFELFGDKLHGGWHLVRTQRGRSSQPEWLLFKDDDEHAAPLEADQLLDDVALPPKESRKHATALAARKSAPAEKARSAAAAARGKPAAAPVKASPRRGKAPQRVDWQVRAAALPGARKAALGARPFVPQLALLADAPPQGGQWVHELKWDGYRILALVRGGKATLWSRNAIEWTAKLPDIVAAIEKLGLDSAALDGELIAAGGGQEDFNALQASLSGERPAPLSYVLFDLLHLQGVSIERAPLLARKALLAELLATPPARIGYSSHWEGDGALALSAAGEQGFEGIISKRADQPYRAGRSDDWRKSKRVHSDEYAVVGYTPPKGARSGFGSLLLAKPDPQHGWRHVGRVGSGFSDRQLRELTPKLRGGESEPTVHVDPRATDLRQARWFAPRFVVEVVTRGIGNQGLLRQPSLKAIRMDKTVSDLKDSDRPAARPARKAARSAPPAAGKRVAAPTASGTKRATPKRVTPKPSRTTDPAPASPARKKRVGAAADSGRAPARKRIAGKAGTAARPPSRAERPIAPADASEWRLTSPERIVYADAGITKREVADYYLAVADLLLQEIGGRPLSIIRCPDGAAGTCFFQKHVTAGLKHVDTVRLKEESGANANYLVVNDLEGLMELVQFNALEFHPWGSRAKQPERADRVVFDLDPGPGVPWTEVKRAAREVRDRLQEIGLVSFLRTSGGKGLHVVVPLNPGCSWGLVKPFARGVCEALAQSSPERYVVTATKSKRDGRIFLDYLRNGRGATSVASWSLRARPGAPVAVPLEWSALARLPRPDAFDLHSAQRRATRLTRHPWEGIGEIRQDLSRWDRPAPPRRR
jgi:bifunctional non-homologous end joining protein LigD